MLRVSSRPPRFPPLLRLFTTSASLLLPPSSKAALPPRRIIPETDLVESFLKGSGPGGQKINKTSSAVQLKHLPTGLVVKSQHTRSRDQNRKLARQILGEKLDLLEKGDESRVAIKAERERTKKASASKKSRRKYRRLEEEKMAALGGSASHCEEDEGRESGTLAEERQSGTVSGERANVVEERISPAKESPPK